MRSCRFAREPRRPARPAWLGLAAVGLLLQLHCARAPLQTGGGVRLVVTLLFNGPVNDNYQYFFLIRNGADPSGQNGPIPVVNPPYLNGFATGNNTVTAAFTDFVQYSRVQRQLTPSGYAVYHLPGGIEGDPNLNIFQTRGEPDYKVPPNGSPQLRFDIALDRLKPNPGEADPNNGAQPRYLQVNVVATTTTPNNPQAVDPAKLVDAFGDQRPGSGDFNRFITIDTAQVGRVYRSVTTPGDPYYEPERDTYPADRDPSVDLIAWTIQITRN